MEETIDLRELIAILLKGKWLIAAITAVAVVIGAIASYLIIDPAYSTTATVSVKNSLVDKKVTDSYLNAAITPANYTERMKDPKVIEQAIQESGVKSYDVETVQSQLTITPTPDTNLLQLTLKGANAAEAAKMLASLIKATKQSLLTTILDNMEEDKAVYARQLKMEKENLGAMLKQYQHQVVELGLPSSVLINITASANQYIINVDEEETKALANLSAEELGSLNELSADIEAMKTVYQEHLEIERQLVSSMNVFNIDNKVLTVNEPIEQASPVSPNPPLNMAIALVLGLMAGAGLVFLRHYWQESKAK